MKDWKIKQKIYHKLNKNFDDDIKNFNVEINEEIVKYALQYFQTKQIGWIYPSKSYVVAICYAKWLSRDFGEDFYSLLNDEELLAGNDPYFVTYKNSKEIYDEIINNIKDFDESKGVIPDIRKYYEEEILWN
jgi:hypothetical protein